MSNISLLKKFGFNKQRLTLSRRHCLLKSVVLPNSTNLIIYHPTIIQNLNNGKIIQMFNFSNCDLAKINYIIGSKFTLFNTNAHLTNNHLIHTINKPHLFILKSLHPDYFLSNIIINDTDFFDNDQGGNCPAYLNHLLGINQMGLN